MPVKSRTRGRVGGRAHLQKGVAWRPSFRRALFSPWVMKRTGKAHRRKVCFAASLGHGFAILEAQALCLLMPSSKENPVHIHHSQLITQFGQYVTTFTTLVLLIPKLKRPLN